MDELYDFENGNNYDKFLKIVRKFKTVKNDGSKKAVKVTGKITQVVEPNKFIIKTKHGKHIPVVIENGDVNVVFDEYSRTLVIVHDSYGDEHTLDADYDVTLMLGKTVNFVFGNLIMANACYELISFWGLER